MKLGRWVGLTMAFKNIAGKSRSSEGQGHSEVNFLKFLAATTPMPLDGSS